MSCSQARRVLSAFVVALTLVSCGGEKPGSAAKAQGPVAEDKVLNVLNWSDYIAPDTLAKFESETGIKQEQVMAYVHYPPSVYQLHVHFSFPYGQYCHRDAYRVHNLASIINNLEIDPEYYLKATLHMAVYRQSLHYAQLRGVFSDGAAC